MKPSTKATTWGNFTSFLRVCCGRYLSLIADRELERDSDEMLALQPAEALLAREAERDRARRARNGQKAGQAARQVSARGSAAKALN